MAEPIPFTVTRYRCPTCTRTGSSKTRIASHMTRCWNDPANRSCKTCEHFEPASFMDEWCAIGQELPIIERSYGQATMPRLHCELWAARSGEDT